MQSKVLWRLTLPKSSSLYQWNLLIRAATSDSQYAKSIRIYFSMLNSGFHGNSHTYPLLFKSCAYLRSLLDVKQLHTHVVKLGFQDDVFVQTSLIDAYSSCSCLESARQVFDEMSDRSEVTWSCMINGYSRQGSCAESFLMLKEMIGLGYDMRAAAVIGVLEGCDFVQGLSLHCCMVKAGLCCETEMLNSVMKMYVRFGCSDGAAAVFNEMKEKSVVSWTIMIQSSANAGDFSGLISLIRRMRLELETFSLDAGVFVSLLSGCGRIGDHLLVASVHCFIVKAGIENQSSIDKALVSMYATCGDIFSSRAAFDAASQKDVLLWTSMISGYVHVGRSREAVDLFRELRDKISPNEVTVLTVLSACADIGSLSTAQEIEKLIVGSYSESDVRVQTSLIHCYCKCGSIDNAEFVFQKVINKDLAVWSAMINTYSTLGMGTKGLRLFDKMQTEAGIKPDAVVYTSVLLACSHSGLVEDGLRYFKSMQDDFGIKANLEHYCCLVDMLSRAGKFDLALKTIQESPFCSQSRVWTPLLSACRIYKNVNVGELAAAKLLDLDPENTSNYVLISNLYTSIGKHKEAAKVRRLIDRHGLTKEAGWSQIEIAGSLHVLLAGDRSHQRTNDIYQKMNELNVQLREAGYTAATEMVTQDLEEEEKEDALKVHSERLAVALGLLSTEDDSTLRIIKNLRTCSDCHSALKVLSKITRRSIIVRDGHRFHHFDAGLCSCNDFW